ncbi:MAG: hypothetical protein JST51_05175 [Armatimonadetes bacterium]|nr:hypothetical protein [Armatimonadota bacterium]
MTIVIVVFTVLAGILAIGLLQTDLPAAARDYDRNRAAAQKQGLFVTVEDVEKSMAVPDADNAAMVVEPILGLPEKFGWDDLSNLNPGRIDEHRAEFDRALTVIEEASRRPRMIFPKDWRNPNTSNAYSASSSVPVQHWLRVFLKMAKSEFLANRPETAGRYLHVAAYLATSLDDCPTLLAQMRRVNMTTPINELVREIIERHGLDPRWQRVAKETLAQLEKPYDSRTMLAIEQWMAIDFCRTYMGPGPHPPLPEGWNPPNEIKYGRFLPMFQTANLSRLYEGYSLAASHLPQDPNDIAGVGDALDKLVKFAANDGLSYTIVGASATALTEAVTMYARDIAERNVLSQAMAAIEKHADLTKGLPLPDHRQGFDGKDLLLKYSGGYWTIYSSATPVSGTGTAYHDWEIRLPQTLK